MRLSAEIYCNAAFLYTCLLYTSLCAVSLQDASYMVATFAAELAAQHLSLIHISHTLAVGLVWWAFGMTLAVGYVVFVYTRFRGKVDLTSTSH